jgi:hypothetical protein
MKFLGLMKSKSNKNLIHDPVKTQSQSSPLCYFILQEMQG